MSKLRFKRGTSRLTIVASRFALKIATNGSGVEGNLQEACIYRHSNEKRRAMLCPVLWCSAGGWFLIATAAAEISEDEARNLRERKAFPDWDYAGPGDIECPFEPKAADWGRVDGRLVALDYAGLTGAS